MTITLRQESATGATTKGSALTYAELDNNFVHLLRQGSVTVRGDSGTDQTLGEADKDSILQLAGGTDISTTISSDSAGESVVTIAYTGTAGIANVVEDTTPQLGGALDAQSNNITNLGTINTHTIPGGTGTFALTSDITGISNVVEDTTPQLGGALDGQGNKVEDVELDNYKETIYTGGSTTGTITPDVANGNVQSITLTGSITFNAFANAETGQSMTLIVKQSATGGETLTSTMKFAGGTKTLSTAPNAIDIISVVYDGTTYYASLATNFS
jgi:hypothetical protein